MQAAPVFIKFWILSKSLALVYICCHRYRILHPDFVLVAALACLEFEVAALACLEFESASRQPILSAGLSSTDYLIY